MAGRQPGPPPRGWAPAHPATRGQGAPGGVAILVEGRVSVATPPRPLAAALRPTEAQCVALASAHVEGLGDLGVAGIYLPCAEAW